MTHSTSLTLKNNFATKAIFISLSFHLSFAILINFSFPPAPTAQKPVMTFLGSILRKGDLAISSASSLDKNSKTATITNINRNIPVHGYDGIYGDNIQKPHTPQITSKAPKKTIKTLFDEPTLQTKGSAPKAQDTEIPVPPRQPLQVQPK